MKRSNSSAATACNTCVRVSPLHIIVFMCATNTHAHAYTLHTHTHAHKYGDSFMRRTMRCVLEGVRNAAAASSVWLLATEHRHNKRAGSLSAGRVIYCVEKMLVSSHSAASYPNNVRSKRRLLLRKPRGARI